jgi:hypothetical protein
MESQVLFFRIAFSDREATQYRCFLSTVLCLGGHANVTILIARGTLANAERRSATIEGLYIADLSTDNVS